MSKKTEQSQVGGHEVFEIIEMAAADIDVLARAFNVISEVCEELNNPHIHLDGAGPKDPN